MCLTRLMSRLADAYIQFHACVRLPCWRLVANCKRSSPKYYSPPTECRPKDAFDTFPAMFGEVQYPLAHSPWRSQISLIIPHRHRSSVLRTPPKEAASISENLLWAPVRTHQGHSQNTLLGTPEIHYRELWNTPQAFFKQALGGTP